MLIIQHMPTFIHTDGEGEYVSTDHHYYFGDVFRLRNTCFHQGWDGSCTWAAHAATNPAHSAGINVTVSISAPPCTK